MHLNSKGKNLVITLFTSLYLVLCAGDVFSYDNTTSQFNLTQTDNLSNNLSINATFDTNISISNQTAENQTASNNTINNQTYTNQTIINYTEQQNKTKDNTNPQNQLKIDSQLKVTPTIEIVSVSTQSFNTSIKSDDSPLDFIYYKNNILAMTNKLGEVTFYYLDFMGSVRGTFDEIGNLLSNKNYLLFGEQIDNGGQYSGKAYTLKEQDRSGFYYFGARYYSPSLGLFVSVDPKDNYIESPYLYAKDNPLKYIDPNGKKAQLIGPDLSDNKKVKNLFFIIGPNIPRVNSVISDPSNHKMANKDYSSDYNKEYKKTEKQLEEKVDGITLSPYLSLLNIDQIKSYGAKKDAVLLHHLFHESIHQADFTSMQDKGIPLVGFETTPEIEYGIEKDIYDSLGLKKSYEKQLVDKNSWVVKSQISQKDYNSLVSVTRRTMESYQNLIELKIHQGE